MLIYRAERKHTPEELKRAHYEGYRAFRADLSKDDNPYSSDDEEDLREAWLDGYHDGWWES